MIYWEMTSIGICLNILQYLGVCLYATLFEQKFQHARKHDKSILQKFIGVGLISQAKVSQCQAVCYIWQLS